MGEGWRGRDAPQNARPQSSTKRGIGVCLGIVQETREANVNRVVKRFTKIIESIENWGDGE